MYARPYRAPDGIPEADEKRERKADKKKAEKKEKEAKKKAARRPKGRRN